MLKRLPIVCLLTVLLLAGSCGYRLARPGNSLLAGISTIAVPYFQNKSYEPGAEALFTEAFVDEFVRSGRLALADASEADVVLQGTIQRLSDYISAYSTDDKSLEYRVAAVLDLVLLERTSGEVLWKRIRLVHAEDYLIGESIATGEAGKREAIRQLAVDLAERVHESIMQGF